MPDPEALALKRSTASWPDRLDRAGPQPDEPICSRALAIREVSIPGAGEADYLLVADRRAVGIIEAKAQGIPLTGVEIQTRVYAEGLTGFGEPVDHAAAHAVRKHRRRDPVHKPARPGATSRQVFGFHRPETLVAWEMRMS